MTVDKLKQKLDAIPDKGAINKARRDQIRKQIMEQQKKEEEGRD